MRGEIFENLRGQRYMIKFYVKLIQPTSQPCHRLVLIAVTSLKAVGRVRNLWADLAYS